MEVIRNVVAPEVSVVSYREEFRAAFEQLNRDWIETYFVLEAPDQEVFSDPQATILARGGQIFFVLESDQVQGTCAVLHHGSDEYEIAKMAVAPAARGRGFGDLLMEAAIGFATEAGAHRLIILSNTVLEPAIRLYPEARLRPRPLDRGRPLPEGEHPIGAGAPACGLRLAPGRDG
jgi:putative acetyltransferase